jgi:AcrR family transcriptional regulator
MQANAAETQRSRLLSATAAVLSERGYGGASVMRIAGRAGVSRKTFYEHFEDREECVRQAFDEALARIASVVAPPYERKARWPEKLRAALTALLQFLEGEPTIASLLFLDTLAAGPAMHQRRARVLHVLSDILDGGRAPAGARRDPPPPLGEAVAGSVFGVIHARLLRPRPDPLIALLSPLMGMIVLPYLGPAAAAKQLARPAPAAAPRNLPATGTLAGLPIRATYRTWRVLAAIAEHPGACNREIGDAAGIAHESQISRLLVRLARLGLIEDNRAGQPPGARNAWLIASKGSEVERALRHHPACARSRGGRDPH